VIYYLKVAVIGVEVRMPESFSALAEDFLFEFRHFLTDAPPEKNQIFLNIQPSSVLPESLAQKRFALFKTSYCRAFGWSRRVCQYPQGSLVTLARQQEELRGDIFGGHQAELAEILRLLVLSLTGEALDRAGFHRIHALAWSVQDKIFLFSAPSGGGKSTLAWVFLRQVPHGLILADETCLVSPGGEILALPLSLSLKKAPEEETSFVAQRAHGIRYKVGISAERICWSGKVRVLAVGLKPGAEFCFTKMSWMDQLRFLLRVTLGLGNAQMREFMLREDLVWELPKIALSRLKTALRLLRASETRSLRLSDQPSKNVSFILNALADSQKSERFSLRPRQRKVF